MGVGRVVMGVEGCDDVGRVVMGVAKGFDPEGVALRVPGSWPFV